MKLTEEKVRSLKLLWRLSQTLGSDPRISIEPDDLRVLLDVYDAHLKAVEAVGPFAEWLTEIEAKAPERNWLDAAAEKTDWDPTVNQLRALVRAVKGE